MNGCVSDYREWTSEEKYALKQCYLDYDNESLAAMFKRSKLAINSKLYSMGLTKYRVWSDDEVNQLKRHYSTTKVSELCKILNRSRSQIYSKAYGLKLTKSRK